MKEAKTHLVYAVILDTSHKQGLSYSDLIAQFPHMSARGNKYIFIEPMQSKNDSKMLQVYQHMYKTLEKVGIKLTINIMDNKASTHVCHFITNTHNTLCQKVAPHCHQANAAKKAIQTTKHHHIADLASTELHFPKN